MLPFKNLLVIVIVSYTCIWPKQMFFCILLAFQMGQKIHLN